MAYVIAVSGKGGVGKTTVSALIVRQLIRNGMKPVLAVDADPNSCLDAALGQKVVKTVGGVREEARDEVQKGLSGVSKTEMLRVRIAESLVEAEGFDLIAMGRPEGPGCYCYANNVLKSVIGEMTGQYPYAVLDNEAGLENLSRRIVQRVDVLILVTDPSSAGLRTIERLHALAREMNVGYGRLVIAVNRSGGELPPGMAEIRAATGADELALIPDDPEIASFALKGKSLLGVSDGNPCVAAADRMVRNFR